MVYHPEVVHDTCRAENKNMSNQGMHNCTTSESTTTHARPCARTVQTNMVRAAELPASCVFESTIKEPNFRMSSFSVTSCDTVRADAPRVQ